MTSGVKFNCSSCASLTSDGELVDGCCPNCAAVIKDRDGLYDFRQNGTDYYFVDIPRSEIMELLKVEKEQGWREAVRFAERKYGESNPYLSTLMVDSRRASWVYLTRPPGYENAMEIGCGWGSSMPVLASKFDHVFAVDLTKERIRFAQQRCLEMGIDNVSFGIGFDGSQFPFESESFDLVAMNGVLAYVPEIIEGNPRQAQLKFLREVRRIIREGGSLYVGSQNRFGWPYLGGSRDHQNFSWTSVMPRLAADMYSKIRKGAGYRTYTYTAGGYKKLFRDAGFKKVDVYWPHHNHASFRLITSLDQYGTRVILNTSNMWGEGISVKNLLVRSANLFGLFTPFAPSYGIVCHR